MLSLSVNLQACGFETTVYSDAAPLAADAEFDANLDFQVKRFKGPKFWRRQMKSRSINGHLKRHQDATIVICDTWKSLEYIQTSQLNHTQVFCLAHGMEYSDKYSAKKTNRIKSVLNKADVVLANSRFTADRLRPFLQSPETLKILNPGVDLPLPPNSEDMAAVGARLAKRGPIITTIGRLEDRKGQDKLLAILPNLLKDFPDLTYVIIGDGPTRDKLTALANNLSLNDHVIFTGQVSDSQKTSYLQHTDLFAMPVRIEGNSVEGFGIVYLEASAHGIPCIAGRSGGAADAVVDQQTGLFCDGDDENDIERAVRALLESPELAKSLGSNGKARVIQDFTWPTIVKTLESYFDPH